MNAVSLDKIQKMRVGGTMLSRIMEDAINMAQPGKTTMDLEMLVRQKMKELKVEPSFTRVRNYQYHTCLSVNDVVVHGIPNDYCLKKGDVIGIDIGVIHQEYNTDMSWSKLVGQETMGSNPSPQMQKTQQFLQAGEKTLLAAIQSCRLGNRIGDISRAIQNGIESSGYFVVKQLVGHAVGKKLHEYPQIPGVLTGNIEDTEELREGMTLAIEVIYAMGTGDIAYKNNDGWSIATRDKSLSGLYEVTVAVGPKSTEILTPIDGLLKYSPFGII